MSFLWVSAWLVPEAAACGGLFCNQLLPVVQNAERIVFDVDEQTGTVDVHVQIFYEGPAEAFAWVVPVPADPELFASTSLLFDQLAAQTRPVFQLSRVIEGRCRTSGLDLGGGLQSYDQAPGQLPAIDVGGGGVEIVSQGQVGVFDTIVLKAEGEEALLAFLQDNDYDVPAELGPVLAPYIGVDAHFVALKLSSDQDAGDITPIAMRYRSDRAMIPIQLTSVAAADDMPLEVYVFGEHRAVPQSYLHVQINEAAIDWWQQGSNYADVISQAADEAGGQAFATDYFGSPEPFRQTYDFDTSRMRLAADGVAWVEAVKAEPLPRTDQLMSAVADIAGAPATADPSAVYRCPSCYELLEANEFDGEVATDALEERFLRGLTAAAALFDRPLMTRMTSSMDAVEMTKDPIFVLNPDLSSEDHFVAQTRTAELVYECGANRSRREDASRRLDLVDGRQILLPSEEWFRQNRQTEFEFIRQLGLMKAQVVEQMDDAGEPEVLTDLTADLATLTDVHNATVRELLGCSCSSGAAGGVAWMPLLLGLTVLRRRRAPR
ncbi:MAG: DUF2330 domain-containing protein [Myxococcales bacterium]|nr:DUF2330 domain-containing protein [Myxococcales bacterium]